MAWGAEQKIRLKTSMHSSRMRTARLLTIYLLGDLGSAATGRGCIHWWVHPGGVQWGESRGVHPGGVSGVCIRGWVGCIQGVHIRTVPEGGILDTPFPCKQNVTRLWKYYLPHTLYAGGNKSIGPRKLVVELDLICVTTCLVLGLELSMMQIWVFL